MNGLGEALNYISGARRSDQAVCPGNVRYCQETKHIELVGLTCSDY